MFLIPVYKTVLKKYKAETKSIRKWSEDSSLALQGCFEYTNWEVFENSCSDIDDLTDVVSSYIHFCKDRLIPQKTVQTFANTKQWITKPIKSLTVERNKAFHAGDLERKHDLQKQIKCEIRRAKNKYKENVEGDLRGNRLDSAWESMHTITGSKTKNHAPLKLVGYQSDIQLAQELNTFYARFDVENFTSEINVLWNKTV